MEKYTEEYFDEIIKDISKIRHKDMELDSNELLAMATGMYALQIVLAGKIEKTYLRAIELCPEDFLPYLRLAKLYKCEQQNTQKASGFLARSKELLSPNEPNYKEFIKEIRLIEEYKSGEYPPEEK